MDRITITKTLEKALEGKGKRKFTQSVEVIFNFRGLDTSKPENRLNLDIQMPKGRGKTVPVVVFGEQQVALEASRSGAHKVFGGAEIQKLAADPKELKALVKTCEFIAAPNMMMVVGKNLGQVLGSGGRLPRPIVGPVADAIKAAQTRVRLTSRGKYLPTVQCLIGSETMSIADLAENFEAAYEKVKARVTEPVIHSVYVKLSMGPAVKLEVAKREK